MAKVLVTSRLVPKEFQNNLPDCMIALEMANRMGVNPIAVMQNLYIVHGKPSWSVQFIVAAINQSGRFKTTIMYEVTGSYRDWETDRKSTRLNSSHSAKSRMPSSA